MRVADGVELLSIYWISGTAPKRDTYRNSVTDPPCFGWQQALVMRGERRSTIFCPYTFTAYTVHNGCSEMMTCKDVDEYRSDWMEGLLNRKWAQYQSFGFQRDYDAAALFMRRLGFEVPAQIMTGGEEDTRKRGGKETGTELLKPVKAKSKRGRFLRWFLDGDGTRSVREAMAEFSMTRSNVLSYLYIMQKDHGIGYTLVGDMATVTLPDGCDDPFDEKQQQTPKTDAKPSSSMKSDHKQIAKTLHEPQTCPQCGGHMGREGHRKTCPLITGIPDEILGDDDDDAWLR